MTKTDWRDPALLPLRRAAWDEVRSLSLEEYEAREDAWEALPPKEREIREAMIVGFIEGVRLSLEDNSDPDIASLR